MLVVAKLILPSLSNSENIEFYNQPRQNLKHVYLQNGFSDVFWAKTIIEKKSMTGSKIQAQIIDCDHFIDLDRPMDIKFAEYCLNEINY